jgi:hypothetical protein
MIEQGETDERDMAPDDAGSAEGGVVRLTMSIPVQAAPLPVTVTEAEAMAPSGSITVIVLSGDTGPFCTTQGMLLFAQFEYILGASLKGDTVREKLAVLT